MALLTELSIRLPNSPGALASLCRLLADERVDIVAISLDTSGQLRVVVDNHVRGAAVLREHHHRVVTHDVLVTAVPDVPGALYPSLALLRDAGVNIEYAYGSTSGGTASVVLGVGDAVRAAAAAGL
jgi:hypothetical protein